MMSEVKAVEHPTLKVPYEILNKKFRFAQKTLDRELSQIQTAASELEKGLVDGSPAADISRLLGGVVERLQVLKRKADESIADELSAGFECKRRLEHLRQAGGSPAPQSITMMDCGESESLTPVRAGGGSGVALVGIDAAAQWKKTRLDRMIVEHLLRSGYYESAERLADRANIRELTNVDIFKISRDVEQDLVDRKTAKCSAWCLDNKSKLRKIGSTIEFQLRRQEFVELIRADRRLDAVMYARRALAPFEAEHMQEIRQCMGLLAFSVDTDIEPYRSLLDVQRWDDLVLKFRLENYRLFQLSVQSMLGVALQAGLSALKTPQCYSTCSKNTNCPVCQDHFNEMAMNLPFSHCAQSRLICRFTGEPLNEHNLPMMLPNGQVFGQMALAQMTQDDGTVTCPKTSETFQHSKIEKVFVM